MTLGWARFVAARLSPECRARLETWNGDEPIEEHIKQQFTECLNAIVNGPAIAGNQELNNASPHPEIVEVEGFSICETARDRKGWLEEAFWEHLACPINPTLSVSSFLRQENTKMKRTEVISTGFLTSPFDYGPSSENLAGESFHRVG